MMPVLLSIVTALFPKPRSSPIKKGEPVVSLVSFCAGLHGGVGRRTVGPMLSNARTCRE